MLYESYVLTVDTVPDLQRLGPTKPHTVSLVALSASLVRLPPPQIIEIVLREAVEVQVNDAELAVARQSLHRCFRLAVCALKESLHMSLIKEEAI